jgi:ArsR family transcriptional regulator, arsenate/arsenite/antimonite-responsive transcriptional repressor
VSSLPLVQCCTPIAAPALSESDAKELERVFKALADRHRVRILNRLLSAGGEAVCVCEFEAMLGLKQSTVSYHLKQLLDAGIVEREKRGSYAYFSIADGSLQRVCALLGYAVAPSEAVAAAA